MSLHTQDLVLSKFNTFHELPLAETPPLEPARKRHRTSPDHLQTPPPPPAKERNLDHLKSSSVQTPPPPAKERNLDHLKSSPSESSASNSETCYILVVCNTDLQVNLTCDCMPPNHAVSCLLLHNERTI